MADRRDYRRDDRRRSDRGGRDEEVGRKRRRGEDDREGYRGSRGEEGDGYVRHRTSDTILASAIRLCNKQQAEEEQVPPAEQLDNLYRAIVRDLHNKSQHMRIILDCAVELSHKTTIYAALIGLLNTEENGFVGELVKVAQEEFEAALNKADRNKARLLLRLFAALVPSNALHASSVLKALQSLIEAAIKVADRGGSGRDEQRVWQPYADFLVYIALMALPWGGQDLAESVPAEMEKLLAEAEKYMDLRPSSHTPALRPFFEGEDAASMSDSGAASFLGQVWDAILEMKSTGNWKVESVPSYAEKLNEAQLATGKPHDLAPFTIPMKIPCLPTENGLATMEAAAAVLAAYPPRGVIRLLPPENTWGEKPKIERLVAEEYILDTIYFFDGDRIECARTLALSLPLEGKLEPILTEVIFSQMMRVPTPHLKPIAYATILADVCRLLQAVPRSMSACIREFFQRMHALDPQLRTHLAEWLAYHLSNFDFMWPWAKWAYVLQAPPHDAQRRFVVDTLSRLVRLSYYGNIVSKVPENYKDLFPPRPEPQSLESAKEAASNTDRTMTDAQQQNGLPANDSSAPAAECKWAAELVSLVRQKKTTEEVLQWISQAGIEDELGGKLGVLKMVLRGLMIAGSKSFTHMLIALERYDSLLTSLLAETGDRGQTAMVSTAADVWRAAPQRAVQAIDRLMAHRLVDGRAIVRWAFSSPGLLKLGDQIASGLAWEAVYNAVNKTLARTQDATEEMQAAQAAADAVQPRAAAASGDEPMTDAGNAEEPAVLDVQDDRQIARQEELTEKQQQYVDAVQAQKDLFLLCFELFRDVLADSQQNASTANGGMDTEAEERKEWYSFTLASLRAFTRRYHAAAAPLSDELETGIFAEDKVIAGVRQAFVDSLHI